MLSVIFPSIKKSAPLSMEKELIIALQRNQSWKRVGVYELLRYW